MSSPVSRRCKDCGDLLDDDLYLLCCDCAACDRFEAEQPEHEQRAREKLDVEGYYDKPNS